MVDFICLIIPYPPEEVEGQLRKILLWKKVKCLSKQQSGKLEYQLENRIRQAVVVAQQQVRSFVTQLFRQQLPKSYLFRVFGEKKIPKKLFFRDLGPSNEQTFAHVFPPHAL